MERHAMQNYHLSIRELRVIPSRQVRTGAGHDRRGARLLMCQEPLAKAEGLSLTRESRDDRLLDRATRQRGYTFTGKTGKIPVSNIEGRIEISI